MISCYKLGPEFTNFILKAFAMICLYLLTVETVAGGTIQLKWTTQGYYGSGVSTYMRKNTLFSFRPLFCKAIIYNNK